MNKYLIAIVLVISLQLTVNEQDHPFWSKIHLIRRYFETRDEKTYTARGVDTSGSLEMRSYFLCVLIEKSLLAGLKGTNWEGAVLNLLKTSESNLVNYYLELDTLTPREIKMLKNIKHAAFRQFKNLFLVDSYRQARESLGHPVDSFHFTGESEQGVTVGVHPFKATAGVLILDVPGTDNKFTEQQLNKATQLLSTVLKLKHIGGEVYRFGADESSDLHTVIVRSDNLYFLEKARLAADLLSTYRSIGGNVTINLFIHTEEEFKYLQSVDFIRNPVKVETKF